MLLANVNAANTDYTALLAEIEKEKPDLVIVQEAGDLWLEALTTIRASHPHFCFVANHDNAGIALYSRFPLAQIETLHSDRMDFPNLVVSVNADGVRFSLISLHPPPPGTDDYLQERNQQLLKVAALVQRLPQPTIVAGDLNISICSPYYSEFVKQSGLVAARQGFGVLPTWPTHNRLIMIPIDHCLVSKDLQVIGCRTGDPIGSDHLPLITDLSFPDP